MQLKALRAFYYIYEQRLLRKIRRQPSPRHVGIILDGNRRHGRSLGLTDPQAIYRLGAQKLDDMLDWCAELAIPAVTLRVFSTDNLQRPPEEVTGIFGAIETKSRTLTPANGHAAVGRQPDDAAPTFSIASAARRRRPAPVDEPPFRDRPHRRRATARFDDRRFERLGRPALDGFRDDRALRGAVQHVERGRPVAGRVGMEADPAVGCGIVSGDRVPGRR